MNRNVKISILVPVYNVERYIDRCARSLFEQTYSNIEFVFVNDCTPDGSMNILNRVLEDYPKRQPQTKILNHEKNRGVAATRNTLVDNATGDYFLWVDADDFITNNAAEILAQKALESDADIICLGSAEYRGNKIIPLKCKNVTRSQDLIVDFLSGAVQTALWGYFIKRKLFANNRIKFVEGFNIGEDLLVLTKLAYYAKTIATVPTILYYWNVTNENSLVHNYTISKSNSELKILDLLDGFFKDKIDLSEYINERKLGALLFNMYNACLENDKNEYLSLKERIKILNGRKLRNTNSHLYRFFLYCNNYPINVMWAKFIYLLKRIRGNSQCVRTAVN